VLTKLLVSFYADGRSVGALSAPAGCRSPGPSDSCDTGKTAALLRVAQPEAYTDDKKVNKSEKGGSQRTPQFSVSNTTYYDYDLIINPKFVVGAVKERRFSFGDMHVSDSFFNEHSCELFDLMEYTDLSRSNFRFEDMLTQAVSAQVGYSILF
jgi:hypothetical protein